MPPVKGKMLSYSEEAMSMALEDVRLGMPVATAAKKHYVPRVTLPYKHKGKTPVERRMGPKTILTKDEEYLIERWIVASAKSKFTVTKKQLLDSVQIIVKELKRETPFKTDRPGRAWYVAFMKRHPQLSERVAQNLTTSRAAVSRTIINTWFREITEYLNNEGLMDIFNDPSRVYNADETALFLNPKGDKVIAAKGEKSVYQTVNNDDKECITVMVNGNAQGTYAPVMIVFKYKKIPQEIALKVPKEWAIGKSDKGWMNGELFYEYIANIYYPWLIQMKIQLPVILFIDGHTSHLTLHTSRFCDENGIILIALPPNSTHIMQPLDIGFFKPMKSKWKEVVHNWRIKNLSITPHLRKADFAPLLKSTLDSLDVQIMKNAFRKSGLVPWNKDAIDYRKIDTCVREHDVQTPNKPIPVAPTPIVTDRQGLAFIVYEIGHEKLDNFKTYLEQGGNDFEESDMSLYIMWKQVYARVNNTTDNSNNNSAIRNDIEIPTAVQIDPVITIPVFENLSEDPLEMQHVHHIQQTPSKDPVHTQNDKHTQKVGPVIPSPFKRAFFWPEPKQTNTSKRSTKEKLPSVVSSGSYQIYLETKARKKTEKDIIKQENAEKRRMRQAEQEAKKEEIKQKRMKRVSNSSSESQEEWVESGSSTFDVSFEFENDDGSTMIRDHPPVDPLEIEPNRDKCIEIDDFVVVKFNTKKNNKFFVGKINACVNEFDEEGYEISFLKHDEDGKFKWPLLEDKSFVPASDIVVTLPQSRIDRRERIFFDYDFSRFKNLC